MAEVLKIQEVKLDLKRVTAQPKSIQPLKIGDNGNVFVVELTDDGIPVDLAGTRVLAVFSRGDGKTAQQDTGNGITVEGNIITIRLRTGSFTDGQNNCEIQVYSGENDQILVTSARFSFDGARGIINDETVEAEDAFPILVELIKEVETANGQAQEAVAAADDAVRRADEAVEKAEGVVETLGDMTQKVYDTNHNGIVDDAERLGGQPPSYYASVESVSEGINAITLISLGGEPARLQFANVSVPKSSFVADSTITDYGYRAAISLSGVTASMVPDVIFSQSSVSLGILSVTATAYNGGIYIYSSEIPEEDIVIPTIIVWR